MRQAPRNPVAGVVVVAKAAAPVAVVLAAVLAAVLGRVPNPAQHSPAGGANPVAAKAPRQARRREIKKRHPSGCLLHDHLATRGPKSLDQDFCQGIFGKFLGSGCHSLRRISAQTGR